MNDFELNVRFVGDDLVFEAVKKDEHFKETFYGAVKELDCLYIYFEEFIYDYVDFLNKKIEVIYDN